MGEFLILRQKGIIDCLKLRRPIYRQTAAYGHFWKRWLYMGRDRQGEIIGAEIKKNIN